MSDSTLFFLVFEMFLLILILKYRRVFKNSFNGWFPHGVTQYSVPTHATEGVQ